MHYENEKMVASITRMISEVVYNLLAHRGHLHQNNDVNLLSMLNITIEQLKYIVTYIVSALPYEIYLEKNSNVQSFLQFYIIQHIVFFILNENIKSEYFKDHLESLKNKILFDLMNQTYVKQ